MSCKLSVNINKIATLRNSRGGNFPNVLQAAIDAQDFGADGITVHPRPDERHITYQDVREIRPIITTEFNIEGNPKEQKFVDLVTEVKPHQVTLVPDTLSQLTSDHGWDMVKEAKYLREIVEYFKGLGIRVSLFVDPVPDMVRAAKATGTDRVELYTEAYAKNFPNFPEAAIAPYVNSAKVAAECGLGVNAGHDLDKFNLKYFNKNVSNLLEVSIGHALIGDSIYLGFQNTIQIYKRMLNL